MGRPLNGRVRLPRATLALATANLRYWLTVAVQVQRELRRWELRAAAIGDPVLRAHALSKLRDERFNAEVAATLATLAPRRRRMLVIRATVAFQVIYDYLDAASEQPVQDPMRNGRQLYRSFAAALSDDGRETDYYRYHPQHDDSGYLCALVTTCRDAFQALPSAAIVTPVAMRTAVRCGEAQTRTHAIPRDGVAQLADWAVAEALGTDLTWWEVAAGAAASVLSVHALIAAAADPCTTAADAAGIDAAYLSISALTTLLDSIVDHDDDVATGRHGYVSFYADADVAAARIGAVAQRGTAAATALPHASHHVMTVTGAAAYYLSAPGARTHFARPIARDVAGALQPLITPILGIFRLWRLAKRVQDRRKARDWLAVRPAPSPARQCAPRR